MPDGLSSTSELPQAIFIPDTSPRNMSSTLQQCNTVYLLTAEGLSQDHGID